MRRARLATPGLVLALWLAAPILGAAGSPDHLPDNFARIDQHLFRGAQPRVDSYPALAALGIKTVVSLREPDGTQAAEEAAVKLAGMRFVSVPMKGFGAPPESSVKKVLDLIGDPESRPVFVHCRRGADRTGTVIARYRLEHDCWELDKALREAKMHRMSWLEFGMRRYIQEAARRIQTAGCRAVVDVPQPVLSPLERPKGS